MNNPHLEGLIRKWREEAAQHVRDLARCTTSDTVETLRDCADELEKALAALPGGGVDGWQPIDTAPKDGTVVLVTVAAKDAEIEKGYFNRGAWYVVNNGDYYDGGHGNDYRTTSVPGNGNYGLPTHWRPLPSTPSPHEADRNG